MKRSEKYAQMADELLDPLRSKRQIRDSTEDEIIKAQVYATLAQAAAINELTLSVQRYNAMN